MEEDFDPNKPHELKLMFVGPHTILETSIDWLHPDVDRPRSTLVLLMAMSENLLEIALDHFSHHVLGSFSEPALVSGAIERSINAFDVTRPEEKDHVQTITEQQITEALRAGILVPVL